METKPKSYQELQRECDEENKRIDAQLRQWYGSGGPRRTFRCEVRGGRIVHVEQ